MLVNVTLNARFPKHLNRVSPAFTSSMWLTLSYGCLVEAAFIKGDHEGSCESACIYETAMNWISDSLSSSLKVYKLGPLGPLANRVPVRGGILSFYRLQATWCSFRGLI